MIAVSLTRTQDFRPALKSGADFLEVRTDYFTDQQLKQLILTSTLPIIYTIKRPTKYLPKVAYIDIDDRSRQKINNKTIRSFHDYKRTPSFQMLDSKIRSILKRRAIPKIATQVNTVADLYTLARLQKKYGSKVIVVGMGVLGLMTRLYNRSLLTYAAVSKTTKTASGQLTVKEMKSTRVFGLVGDDIQHSLSPKLHSKQKYTYQLWQTDDLDQFMFIFSWFQLPGASVTKPFKIDVMQYCDRIDLPARKIGAVNTLVRKNNQLTGYNTDWIGVQKTLGKYMTGKTVLILGKGGAAKAVAYAVKKNKGKVGPSFDVLVNATPVRDQLLVPAESLRGKVVMDCNYGKMTKLCRVAKQQHAKVVLDGLPMLRYQAAEQIKLYAR